MPQPAYKLCPRCGTPADVACPQCHHCQHVYRTQFNPNQTQLGLPQPLYQPQQPAPLDVIQFPPGQHSAVIAVLISIFCCAFAGQLYNRQILKGLVLGAFAIFFAFFTYGLSIIPMYLLMVVDAACIATKLQQGRAVTPWQFF